MGKDDASVIDQFGVGKGIDAAFSCLLSSQVMITTFQVRGDLGIL